MLKKALKLDQVHIFGDLSVSQLLEKMDLMTELTVYNQLKENKANTQTLITMISIAWNGILTESE